NSYAVAKATIQAFLDEVVNELAKGNRLEFRDFGVFSIIKNGPRVARNPQTGEKIPIPAKKRVKFKPGRIMKQKVQGDAPS
ncbi:unnamed protein product, partial [marine sediment metagenome]